MRTRLGKIVGSVHTDPSGWTCWLESGRWVVVAPSGARIETFETEAEARAEVERRNEEWFA